MSISIFPSLEHIALVKVSVELWKEENSVEMVNRYFRHWKMKNCLMRAEKPPSAWKWLNTKLTEKSHRLPIPSTLKSKMENMIRVVGIQIFKWIIFHDKLNEARKSAHLIEKLCWTWEGAIDKKRTAETLVTDERLSVATRYSFACVYCLEEAIFSLWRKLKGKKSPKLDTDLVSFWYHKIRGTLNRYKEGLGSPNDYYFYALINAAVSGNAIATEYLARKLISLKMEESVVLLTQHMATRYCNAYPYNYTLTSRRLFDFYLQRKISFKDYFSEVVRVLLCSLSVGQREQLVRSFSTSVLVSLTDWRSHRVLREVWCYACTASSSLAEADFNTLLCMIILNMEEMECYEANYYKCMFLFLWTESPERYRRYVLKNSRHVIEALAYLRDSDKWQIFELVLESATDVEKVSMVGNSRVSGERSVFEDLILSRKYELCRHIFGLFLSSRATFIRFREESQQFCLHAKRVMLRILEGLVDDYNLHESFILKKEGEPVSKRTRTRRVT